MATKYYVVLRGYQPGIYRTWKEAEAQIRGYPSALYQSFKTKKEALHYFSQLETARQANEQIAPLPTIHRTVVYTDGSSKSNIGGYGVLIKYADGTPDKEICGRVQDDVVTNNQAELFAVAVALVNTQGPVTIVPDSQYVIDCVTINCHNWKANGWKNRDGKTVPNANYIKFICEQIEGRDVKFIHVKGHSRNPYNDRADYLADLGRQS